ncbi:hypothetical protein PoB_003885500 [Plakobranchus ocellatus]|uniref:Uncharacterized protein n=1 Tax=Plakobranchus ocellatus TaxID=259542 RepID=A0AAV4AYI8_9GAST|nr:hypothetical protein PoB_003885500 [Plakobranchus ocellatus]
MEKNVDGSNWSQSNFSSNRQSLESEAAKYSSVGHSGSSSRLSQHSQGRDSGRGSPKYLHKSRHELDQGYMGDAASTESVVSSSSTAADGSSTVAEGSSCNGDDWLRALAERAASRGDVTSTSAEALAQLSRVTRQNIQNLDLLVPGRKHKRRSLPPQDLDNESIYSVDQEGFFTSFHTDSGLKRSSTELLDTEGEDERQESLSYCGFDDDLILPPREIRGSKSLQSMSSSNTMGSIMVRPQLDKDLGWSSTSVSSPDLVCLSGNKKTSQVGHSRLEDQGEVSESSTAGHSGSDLSCELDDRTDCTDTGTIKPREKKKKLGPPPPPPPRSSSISSSSTNNKTRDPLNLSNRRLSSDGSIDSSVSNTTSLQAVNASPQCPQPAASSSSSSPDEGSDHETIYARLKLKTSISVHTFPSWCAGLVSDDEDLASVKANPLSASHERLHAEASEVQEMFTKGHVGSLLHNNSKANPSPFSTTAVVLDDLDFPANSWPRGKRLTSAGILKTPEKEKITKGSNHGHSKTLNFDPVVNLFDAQTPHSVQMPLSYLSSSDESGSSPPPGPIPSSSTHNRRYHGSSGTSSKDVPFVSSTPASGRNQSLGRAYRENKQKQVGTQNYSNRDASSSVSSSVHNSTTGSNFTGSCASITSISSINSLEAADAGHMSSLTGSCSTIALSDIDSSSLTRVSLNEGDGNCSISSASSSLSLNWDTDGTPKPTPVATPARARMPLSNQRSTAKPDALKLIHCGQKDALPTGDRVSSNNYSPGPNSTLRDQGLPAHTNQSKSIPVSQLPVLPDSCPSSATPTPTLTPNPANIPPMQPMEANYLPDSTVLKSKDKNNNKAAFFNFPNSAKIESCDIPLNLPHSQQNTHADQNGKSFRVFTNLSTVSSITASPLPSSSSNRRRSSPAVSHKGYIPQGPVSTTDSEGESRDNLQGQRGRRQSGDKLADRSTGSTLGSSQPKLAVQPFLHTPPSTAAAAVTHTAHLSKPSIVSSQHKPSSISAPLIKPQLLREVRTDNTKFPVKQSQGFNSGDNAYRKPKRNSNGKDILPGSCHSSQESLSYHLFSSSTSRLVSKNSKTDLSQPSLRSGTSSESLQSNSSAGRSDSYRVALLTEADQMSLIQEKKTAPPESVRTTRSGSLNEQSLPSNSIDRSRSSSLSSNNSLSHTAQYPSYSKHSHLSKSMSAPIATDNQNVYKNTNCKMRNSSNNEENEPVSRADSYRCAMQSSQNALLQGDIAGRNCSYRLATHDEDDDDGGVVVNLGSGNSRMDACNLWSGMSGTSRDVRRMGITDVDQLKGISADRTNGNKSSTDTQHARKKFGVRPEGGKAAGSLGDPKRMPGQGRNGSIPGVTLRDKSNKQQKLHSSSYIRFDPIFESGEDLRASKESLRPPSIVSVRTLAMTGSKETLVSDIASRVQVEGHSRTRSPTRRRSSSQGRRGSGDDDRTRNGVSQSIFGSIKTTIKAIGSGGKGE